MRFSDPAHALDGGTPIRFHVSDHWPAASDVIRCHAANSIFARESSTGGTSTGNGLVSGRG
jgi:hypothetical protein